MSDQPIPVCVHGIGICTWLNTHYYCPVEGHPLNTHHGDGTPCVQDLEPLEGLRNEKEKAQALLERKATAADWVDANRPAVLGDGPPWWICYHGGKSYRAKSWLDAVELAMKADK